jgi:hypothetical protein
MMGKYQLDDLNSGPGSIIITKTVENADGADLTEDQENEIFTFTVVFSDGGKYAYTVGDTTEFLRGDGKITLKHGQTAVFANLPPGITYTVLEEMDDTQSGYTSTVSKYDGNVTNGERILPFVNVYDENPDGKLGTISISKNVTGTDANAGDEFTFTITFTGEGAPEPITFTLADGETWTSAEIPHGTAYTVTESAATGYIATLTDASGIIAGNHEAQVSFDNRKIPGPPEPETTSITIQKIWNGEDANRPLSVDVQLYKNGEPYGGIITLSAANGWTHTWTELDKDFTWTVDETNVPLNYVKTVTGDADNGFVITNSFIEKPVNPVEPTEPVEPVNPDKPEKPEVIDEPEDTQDDDSDNDNKVDTGDKKPNAGNSKTGDDSYITLWLSMMCMSSAGLLFIIRCRLKRRR